MSVFVLCLCFKYERIRKRVRCLDIIFIAVLRRSRLFRLQQDVCARSHDYSCWSGSDLYYFGPFSHLVIVQYLSVRHKIYYYDDKKSDCHENRSIWPYVPPRPRLVYFTHPHWTPTQPWCHHPGPEQCTTIVSYLFFKRK